MWEQIRSNQIRSVVLVAMMGVLLLLLGYFLGLLFWIVPSAVLLLP